jgi:hypothetical protein
MSDGKMVMDKNLIIAKMVSIAERNNLAAMKDSGMETNDIMNMSDQVRPQLFKIQEDILNTLISEKIISIVDD